MENFKKHFIIEILILSISILLCGVIIGYSIKTSKQSNNKCLNNVGYSDREVLSLKQVSEYLNMSEEDVKGIINTEKNKLESTHSFSGRMFPYVIVNNKYYFYKDAVNEWLKDASFGTRQYDTVKQKISQWQQKNIVSYNLIYRKECLL